MLWWCNKCCGGENKDKNPCNAVVVRIKTKSKIFAGLLLFLLKSSLLSERWMWWGCSKGGCRDAPGRNFAGVPGWGCGWPQSTCDLETQSEFMVVLGIFIFLLFLIMPFLTVVQLLTSLGRRLSL